jgi:hypothetical protein
VSVERSRVRYHSLSDWLLVLSCTTVIIILVWAGAHRDLAHTPHCPAISWVSGAADENLPCGVALTEIHLEQMPTPMSEKWDSGPIPRTKVPDSLEA